MGCYKPACLSSSPASPVTLPPPQPSSPCPWRAALRPKAAKSVDVHLVLGTTSVICLLTGRRASRSARKGASVIALQATSEDLDDFRRQVGLELDEGNKASQERIAKLVEASGLADKARSVGADGGPDETTSSEEAVIELPKSTTIEGLRRLAICTSSSSKIGQLFVERVRRSTTERDQPTVIDLAEASQLNFEVLDSSLARCRAVVVCPDIEDEDRRSLTAMREGLKAILASVPLYVKQVVLLSRVGAQDIKSGFFSVRSVLGLSYDGTWAGLEDVLTVTARRRKQQLRVLIVRAGPEPTNSRQKALVRCTPEDAVTSGTTSPAVAAEALLQAIVQKVNTNLCVLGDVLSKDEEEMPTGQRGANLWLEQLLPYIGPEIWRTEVEDASRAASFVQGWAKTLFGARYSAAAAAVTRDIGVKTPVESAKTPFGVILKFRPLGTPSGVDFPELSEGGLEFIAEAIAGQRDRLRVRRCAYGWKVATKQNSERALLRKFQEDLSLEARRMLQ